MPDKTWTIEEIVRANHDGGFSFFRSDVVRDMGSRVASGVFQDGESVCFITADRPPGEPHTTYAVRVFETHTGEITTMQGAFGLPAKIQAIRRAKRFTGAVLRG